MQHEFMMISKSRYQHHTSILSSLYFKSPFSAQKLSNCHSYDSIELLRETKYKNKSDQIWMFPSGSGSGSASRPAMATFYGASYIFKEVLGRIYMHIECYNLKVMIHFSSIFFIEGLFKKKYLSESIH